MVEQGRRRCEGVDLRCVERRDFRVVGGVVQHKGGGVAVIVRRPQEAIPRGDPVPGGERSLTQFGHPARGALPGPVPTGLVTIGNPVGGGQHLAQVRADVVRETGRP
ncbi:MAG TPA: hypothetical protein VGL46_26785 [Pseudonocardiaceae bacterium]